MTPDEFDELMDMLNQEGDKESIAADLKYYGFTDNKIDEIFEVLEGERNT